MVTSTKQPQERLIQAIRTVLSGNMYLSEKMIQRMLSRVSQLSQPTLDPVEVDGSRIADIPDARGRHVYSGHGKLKRSVHTIETHREKIKRKLNLQSANDLVQSAVHWVIENES